jgi:hypothetical protein
VTFLGALFLSVAVCGATVFLLAEVASGWPATSRLFAGVMAALLAMRWAESAIARNGVSTEDDHV